jgi:uncharacterized protein with HEPN domain
MRVSIERIHEYLGDLEFIQFSKKNIVVDAVVRNFEIVGEASKNIPNEIKEKYPEIPWRKMYSLRNLVTHEYFGIDYEMIWEIAKFDLPQNLLDLKNIIEIERKNKH